MESCTLGPRRNIMPDPDSAKDQDPTQPEASTEDAPDGTELTDEQLEKAAGGIVGIGGFGGEGGTAGSVD
jgi:hypothetical protein